MSFLDLLIPTAYAPNEEMAKEFQLTGENGNNLGSSRIECSYSSAEEIAAPEPNTVSSWITIIKKAESAYPDWSGVKMTNAMRRLAGYDSHNFREMFGGSPQGDELKARGTFTESDITHLQTWTMHDKAGAGLVKDNQGNELSAGHVLSGLSAGVYRDEKRDLTPPLSFAFGEIMDNLYAVTISGDLGQAAVYVNEGKQKRPYIGSHGDAEEAEIIGDIDGFNLGFKEKLGGSGKKLSQILQEYYFSDTKSDLNNRLAIFKKNDNGKLKDQVRRFATTYLYVSESKIDAMTSEVTTEAEAATDEFWQWFEKKQSGQRKK